MNKPTPIHTFAFFVSLCTALPSAAAKKDPCIIKQTTHQRTTHYTFEFARPTVWTDPTYAHVEIAGCEPTVAAGMPSIPRFDATLLAPEGYEAKTIKVNYKQSTTISIDKPVFPEQREYPLSKTKNVNATRPNAETYASRAPFPRTTRAKPNHQVKHGERIISVPLFPVQYKPAAGKLLYRPNCTVSVTWTRERKPLRRRGTARDDQEVRLLTFDAPKIPGGASPTETATARADGEEAPLTTALADGHYEHVILSPASFVGAAGTNGLQAIVDHRNATGVTSTNVPIDWVLATYDGTRPDGASDDPTKVRNFLKDAYHHWGTRFLLLVGDEPLVPYRQLHAEAGFEVTEVPSDLYYACLDGSFDHNANGVYGEVQDGIDGSQVDFFSEIAVGRWLVDSLDDVTNIVAKTLRYETSQVHRLQNVAMCGEYLGFGGISDYSKAMMEEIRTSSHEGGYATEGFEGSHYGSFYDTTRVLYDQDDIWPKTNAIALMNEAPHVINHMGHGAYYHFLKMYLGDVPAVTNREPTLIYSQACEVGAFDKTDDCFAETLLTHPYGIFAGLLNVRFGWGRPNTTDGTSQRYNRMFWDSILEHGVIEIGRANHISKERLAGRISTTSYDSMRWTAYAMTLFGDPATPFSAPVADNPIEITHTPLDNQLDSLSSYRVSCELNPSALVEPASNRMIWTSSASPGETNTVYLPHVGNGEYTTNIPQQPYGAEISYRIMAQSRAGTVSTSPAASHAMHGFHITGAIALQVGATPSEQGMVSPPYGTTLIASGSTVTATAPRYTTPVAGERYKCNGWTGTGDLNTGSGTNAQFVLTQSSGIEWIWARQYLLEQSSSPISVLQSNEWYMVNANATTETAATRIEQAGVFYRFAHWEIDTFRVPAAGTALNPLTSITMDQPHQAVAIYIAETLDSDTNNIADWWELHHSGTTGISLTADPDGDLFTNKEEFDDFTNPNDPGGRPAPPHIAHTPLSSPHTTPPAYALSATVTDTRAVASVTLVHTLENGTTTNMPMVNTAPDTYATEIPREADLGPAFSYWIVATDPAGYTATHGPHNVILHYPIFLTSKTNQWSFNLRAHETGQASLTMSNSGFSDLSVDLLDGWMGDIQTTNAWSQTEPTDTHTWNHWQGPDGQYWHVPLSTPGALEHSVHARLDTKEFLIGPGARLSFDYCVDMEEDPQRAGYAYDGVIIEVSTNAGATFHQLTGPYTHRISEWDLSPWSQGTYCLSGRDRPWTNCVFDLSAYEGTTAEIRFHAGGDDNTSYNGFKLDNVTVSPVDAEPAAWITPSFTTTRIAPSSTTQLFFAVTAAGGLAGDQSAVIDLKSDDPVGTNQTLRFNLTVNEPAQVSFSSAHARPDGTGLFVMTNRVSDANGETCAIRLEYSGDNGLTWTPMSLVQSESPTGDTYPITNTCEVISVPTENTKGLPDTNVVVSTWNSVTSLGNVVLTNVQIRATAIDSLGAGPAEVHSPVLIDNEAPDGVVISSATPVSTWTRDATPSFSWTPSNDGSGSGLAGYSVTMGHTPSAPAPSVSQTETLFTAQPLADASDWWLCVTALDRYGNKATTAAYGPLLIDQTPPDSRSACTEVIPSDFGPYVVGPDIGLHWSGFHDIESGVNAYLVSFEPALDSPQLMPCFTNNATVSRSRFDEFYTLYVWANDLAGNISSAAVETAYVRNPTNDYDGDAFSTGQEELAGTNDDDSNSVFRVFISHAGTGNLHWTGHTARTYGVLSTDKLGNTWSNAASLTGTNGVMHFALPPGPSTRFYRVNISPSP